MQKNLMSKLAYVPTSKPGFDEGIKDMRVPVMVQLNPDEEWEFSKPETLEEDRMKAVVQHLVSSKAISAARSYCSKCAAENEAKNGTPSNYVPIIMMPINPADQCPFDVNCEVEKTNKFEKIPKKKPEAAEEPHDSKEDEDKQKTKKRVSNTFQRLTDFDLMSQW